MRERLVTVLSDAEPTNTDSLQKAIDAIPNVSRLKHQPEIITEIVDENIRRENIMDVSQGLKTYGQRQQAPFVTLLPLHDRQFG